jgi:ribosomal protein S2
MKDINVLNTKHLAFILDLELNKVFKKRGPQEKINFGPGLLLDKKSADLAFYSIDIEKIEKGFADIIKLLKEYKAEGKKIALILQKNSKIFALERLAKDFGIHLLTKMVPGRLTNTQVNNFEEVDLLIVESKSKYINTLKTAQKRGIKTFAVVSATEGEKYLDYFIPIGVSNPFILNQIFNYIDKELKSL